MNKQLVKVELPDGTIYDSSNPLNISGIPVGSHLTFAVSTTFPSVYFTGILLKDALPLLSGPNDQVYNIQFQTDAALKDMSGATVPINDANGNGTADNNFNGLTLSGDHIPNAAWISLANPNYLLFDLGSG